MHLCRDGSPGARPVQALTIDETILDQMLAEPLPSNQAQVGYVGFDIPDDILCSPGCEAVHLPWWTYETTPLADRVLESKFPPIARAIVEGWLRGDFNHLRHVIFSRGFDPFQRLYYYLSEMQRAGAATGPTPLVYDCAYQPRCESLAHTINALRTLCAKLELDDAALREGIVRSNVRRSLLADLDVQRSGQGPFHEKIARFALDTDAPLELIQRPSVTTLGYGRVMLAGTPPPDHRLHLAVERAGWTVVGETHDLALDRLGCPIDPDGRPAVELIGANSHRAVTTPRSVRDQSHRLMERTRITGAQAVIIWVIGEDEVSGWHIPRQTAALHAAGIPCLVMSSRDWFCRDGAGDEIAAFLEGLDL